MTESSPAPNRYNELIYAEREMIDRLTNTVASSVNTGQALHVRLAAINAAIESIDADTRTRINQAHR